MRRAEGITSSLEDLTSFPKTSKDAPLETHFVKHLLSTTVSYTKAALEVVVCQVVDAVIFNAVSVDARVHERARHDYTEMWKEGLASVVCHLVGAVISEACETKESLVE